MVGRFIGALPKPTVDKKAVNVPDISEVGTYEVTVKLHPEVTGTFKLAVEKA